MIRFLMFALVIMLSSGHAIAANQMEIKAVQALLNILGYEAGPADGAMGAATRQAVRSFLQARDLNPNTKIDKELLDSLVTAIAENASIDPSTSQGQVSLHSAKIDIQAGDLVNIMEGHLFDRARLFIRFSNETDKTVVGVEHKFVIKNAFGTVLHQGRDQMEIRISPKKVSSGDLFYFWEDLPTNNDDIYDDLMPAISSDTANVEVEIIRVIFSDGTTQ